MDNEEKLSVRGFAKAMGVSHTLVQRAIKNGYIQKGYDTQTKQITPSIARDEWAAFHKINKNTPAELAISLNSPAEPSDDAPKSPMHKAREMSEVLKARLLQLELDRELGKYVKIDDVRRAQFAFAKEIKTALLQIPDRYIDEILSAKSRNDAHAVLYKALEDTLQMLSDMNSRTLKTTDGDGTN